MTVPPEAITAAAAAIERELLSGKDYSMAVDSDEALATAALEAAAPLIAAASHRVWLEHVIGYQIDGKIYHPSDVQIVLRGAP